MHPGETYFFKIDYYLLDMRGGSKVPPIREKQCAS
jgi:hypothetical protein